MTEVKTAAAMFFTETPLLDRYIAISKATSFDYLLFPRTLRLSILSEPRRLSHKLESLAIPNVGG